MLDCRKYFLMRSSFKGAIITESLYTDLDSNPGDNNAPNQGGTPAQGSSQKASPTAAGEAMGPPSSKPPGAQRAASGSPSQPGSSLLTPAMAKGHQEAMRTARMVAYQASLSTRYRINYRELLEQFLTIIFPSSTIGSTTIFPHTASKASPRSNPA